MGKGGDPKGQFFVYAALWGMPGLLTLYESYRLFKLPSLKNTDFFAGPVGYMCGVGFLLMGFCIWEIVGGLKDVGQKPGSEAKASRPSLKRIYLCVAFMGLFLILMPVLGFILASGVFLGTCLRLLGCSLPEIVATVLVYCISFYWFLPYFGISLPQGLWGI